MRTLHTRRSARPIVALTATVAILAGSVLLVLGAGGAAATDITPVNGPITKVSISPTLNCQVFYSGDTSGEFYNKTDSDPGDCGTWVTDGTHLYGPATISSSHGVALVSASNYVAWTPVSQSAATGSGTSADPYKIATTVSGGPFTVVETDSYIDGQSAVQTDVKVTSSTNVNAVVYRSGDCYLQDDDNGRGRVDNGTSPICQATTDSTSPNRIEEWIPLTSGSHYMEDYYGNVDDLISTMAPFPDTIEAGDDDNGAGVSWSQSLVASVAQTFSELTNFSPSGTVPLTLAKTASVNEVDAGGQFTYTITISNPNTDAKTVSSITDSLPAGFTYRDGTSSGVTTGNPTTSGQALTWSGTFSVPASTNGVPGTITLTFGVTASQDSGTYTNAVDAAGPGGLTVIGISGVAPVKVDSTTTTSSTSSTSTSSTTTSSSTSSTTTSTTAPPATPPTTTSPSGVLPATTAPVPPSTVAPARSPGSPAAPVDEQPTYTG